MSARKPIGKTKRFEIFKRDGFICQYCGAHPPNAVLELDHIVPVSQGGDNDDTNLVTACFDCNRGKRNRLLDTVPKSLAERAAEVAEREAQLKGYNSILMAARQRLEDDVWQVADALWGADAVSRERFASIGRFVEILGLPEVLDAADVAKRKPRSDYAEWKYFCGVCWKKIRDAGL